MSKEKKNICGKTEARPELIVPGGLIIINAIGLMPNLCPIFTADADATQLLSRVGGVYTEFATFLLATVSTSLNKFANSEQSCVVSAV